jgi:hypothetical protein
VIVTQRQGGLSLKRQIEAALGCLAALAVLLHEAPAEVCILPATPAGAMSLTDGADDPRSAARRNQMIS